MRYRHILLAVTSAGLTALAPAVATADPGATLTVAGQVQAAAGAKPVLQPSFSFPESTPFCTNGVDFTWDGAAWISEFPIKNGGLCVTSGINVAAPNGHDGAGQHEICGSAGPRFRDCKTVTVVLAAAGSVPAPASSAGATAGATSGAGAPARSAPAGSSSGTSAPANSSSSGASSASNAPAPARAIAAATHLLPVQVSVGIVVLVISVIALLAVLLLAVLLRGRGRSKPALPSPDQQP